MLRAINSTMLAIVICAALLPTTASAAVVKLDMLAGIGDFEVYDDTSWISLYSGSDYDYNTQCGWASAPGPDGTRWGYDTPSPDDSVATGWRRVSTSKASPAKNMVFRAVPGDGVAGSTSQYFAVKAISGGVRVHIENTIAVSTKGYVPHPGDQVTLQIDRVRMSDFSDRQVTYTLEMVNARNLNTDTQPSKVLTPSLTPVQASLTGIVKSGVQTLTCRICIDARGDLGTKQPGIYLDGAHLWIKRAGASDYDTIDVPVRQTGGPRTYLMSHTLLSTTFDPVQAAVDYDSVLTDFGPCASSFVRTLRYYNPAIRIYLYGLGGTVLKSTDDRGLELYQTSSPFKWTYVVRDRSAWLYGDGAGGFARMEAFPTHCYAKVELPTYCSEWAAEMSRRVKKYGYDGVWIDDLGVRAEKGVAGKLITPEIQACNVQKFLHSTSTSLHTDGLYSAVLASGTYFHKGPGEVWADPTWTLAAPYNTADYANNDSSNTPDALIEEYAFFYPVYVNGVYNSINYSRDHWLSCIQSMESLKQINIGRAADKQKSQFITVNGPASADYPALGNDGWLQYGVASYLLACNDFTRIGLQDSNTQPLSIDYAMLRRLGTPNGDRQPYKGDAYFCYRRYAANADGGVGGVVVVNGYTDVSKTYTVDFDAFDESGANLPVGTSITLKPHTGRILLSKGDQLDVRLVTSTQSVVPGQLLDVSVEYRNVGSSELRNVTVRAEIPAQTVYVQGSAEQTGGSYDATDNAVRWPVLRVAVGASGTKTFKVKVK